MKHFFGAAALAVLFAAGCATPAPDGAPNAKLVILQVPDDKVRIISVDGDSPGMSLGTREAGYLRSGTQRVELAPGKHTVQIRFQRGSTHAEKMLWFVGEPGETYLAQAQVVGYSIRFWIEEQRTGRPVGGVAAAERPAPAQPFPR